DIDAGQPLAMPRRALDGQGREFTQALCAMERQPIRRPVEPLNQARRERHRVRLMAPPKRLVVTHLPPPFFVSAPAPGIEYRQRRRASSVRLRCGYGSWYGFGSREAELAGAAHELQLGIHAQLGVNAGEVGLDRPLA